MFGKLTIKPDLQLTISIKNKTNKWAGEFYEPIDQLVRHCAFIKHLSVLRHSTRKSFDSPVSFSVIFSWHWQQKWRLRAYCLLQCVSSSKGNIGYPKLSSCNIYRTRKRSLPRYQNTVKCVEKRGRRHSFLTNSRCFEILIKNYFKFFM